MRILWLYQYMPLYDFDHQLHMSFAKFLASYPGVYLKAYGPHIDKGYPLINLYKYHKEISMEQIYQEYKFDIAIINTKSRCFEFYNPKTKEARGGWLPSDFSSWNKTPKVVIEEDYHYETDDDWYQEMNIDLILQRHYSQSLRQQKVPMKFFPFSIDIASFNTWKTECIHKDEIVSIPYERIKKVAFIGNCNDEAYLYRRQAINNLILNGIGITYSGCRKVDGEYLETLRKYVGYVSCGSTYDICAGKNLEIMASGGVLFTNNFKGIDLLFPKNSYCEYKQDGSDVVEKATDLLQNSDKLIETVQNARKCVYERHTHDIRTIEMLDLFKKEL